MNKQHNARRSVTPTLILLLILSALTCSSAALARDKKPFITGNEINLAMLLPPPPANNSMQTREDLAEVLRLQVTRTPAMVARAQADEARNVWCFADVMGPQFTKGRLPVLAAFFRRLVDSGDAVVDPYKNMWNRPRPPQYSSLVKPVVKLSTAPSYPSKHATDVTLMGIVLSNMVPEKRADIMARAADYAHNRVVGGIHFPSDVEAGQIVGTVIAARLQTQDDFNAAFAAARDELRLQLLR
jgi:acid phosphatase (class A)